MKITTLREAARMFSAKRAKHLSAWVAALLLFTCALPASADLFGYKSPGMHPEIDGLKGPKVDERDFVSYARKGYGSIKGHLGINDTGENGHEVTFSANDVYLVPATPYTKWYFMSYVTTDLKRERGGIFIRPHQDRLKFVPFDAVALKYTRVTRTDADGRYQFLGLPTGHYYVIAFVSVIENGTNVRGGYDGPLEVTNYKAERIGLLGDDPPLDVSGDRPGDSSALVRIVPSVRVLSFCAIGTVLHPCNDVVDLDQFLGRRSEY